MSEAAVITLSTGNDRCDIYPALGASLGRWTVGNQEMLRVASHAAIVHRDPLGMSSFPLLPYSNRIGHARFDWGGRTIQVAPNFAPEPHAIHGTGWKRQWAVSAMSASATTLHLEHAPDRDWPWAFSAEQEISLSDGVLTLVLRATNRETIAVPLAFGHHPYFDQHGASLTFEAQEVWEIGEDGLPSRAVRPAGQFDFRSGGPVSGRSIDHGYGKVSGPATVTWEGRGLKLEITTSPQLPAAVVYVPKGGDAFCFEPVPHIINALNLPGQEPAMPVLRPGQTSETTMTLRASPK